LPFLSRIFQPSWLKGQRFLKKSFGRKRAYSLAKVAKIDIKNNFPVQRRWQLNFHYTAKCTKQNTWKTRPIHISVVNDRISKKCRIEYFVILGIFFILSVFSLKGRKQGLRATTRQAGWLSWLGQ
jgi:hypothetical protein